ncbi:Hypothetical protein RG1141_CH01390 [Neorhizobium galegae bv. officinalis bv. officinalis str. HAMBI 1141]|uniref:Uncharacterized protein n=1 Tax=Neorhizobium galegae bv. officinalis bv. officinalis str. HAMBI 1141 TaxID=1028801 RepID=A0A068T334_NEOGA|nr:hypothetical protein [Neorhizobium galegae]CDN52504.1 Hypothetical protein RG1141_CH01390 [Neorhizobium galegae bv. officinalis bv. officinalis str. HAMBI 1141]
MSRVDTRLTVWTIDEDAIRKAFLSGERPGAIANRHGSQAYGAVAGLIYAKKRTWLAAEPFSRELSDAHRIVLHKHVQGDNGSHVVRIPLPRVSMHVRALTEGHTNG